MKSLFGYNKNNKTGNVKSKIIEYFIANGNATNTDLSKEFNLSIPTIVKIINDMCDEGFVIEYGKLETEEGRHPSLYGINPESGYFVGVDIDSTCVRIGLTNFRGDLIDLLTDNNYVQCNTQESLDELCQIIINYINKVTIPKEKILCININIPGRINPDTGYSYSIFNFSEVPLTTLLGERLGVEVTIENDTRAMTYGEYLKGCVAGEQNVLFVNVSWGLALGMIIDGKLYKGKSGFAGEFGHTYYTNNEIICHCGKKGCLETEVSGSAFVRVVKEKLVKGESSIVQLNDKDTLTLESLINATCNDDTLCIEVVEDMGHKLGRALAGLINIFNPELVVIGGCLSATSEYFMHAIKSSVLKYSLNLVNRVTTFVISKLKERAGVIGACLIARKNILQI